MINKINEVVLSPELNARLNALAKLIYVDQQITDVLSTLNTGDINTLNGAKTYTNEQVASLVNSAPNTLDTLNELAKALGDDPNFATTVSTQIGKKADKILVPINNNILSMDESGNLKNGGISSSDIGQLSVTKDWIAKQNFNGGANVQLASNAHSASDLINTYPLGYSVMLLQNNANGFPVTTGYGFVITFNLGTTGYQEIVEMYTGTDTTTKQRRWFRTKRDSNNFWQPFQQIWTDGSMGIGSGLDADKLHGQDYNYYLNYNNLSNRPDIYTKTDINGIVNGLTTKNDLNVAIDDVQIGGRNLVTNSDFTLSNGNMFIYGNNATVNIVDDSTFSKCLKVVTSSQSVSGVNTSNTDFPDRVVSGRRYSYSFWLKAESECNIYVGIQGSGLDFCKSFEVTTNWQQFKIEKDLYNQGNSSLRFYTNNSAQTFYVTKIKVENGDKATDWTPAPEDDKAYVDDKTGDLTTLQTNSKDNLVNSINEVKNDIPDVYTKTDINGIVGTATLDTTDKTLKGAINEIKESVTSGGSVDNANKLNGLTSDKYMRTDIDTSTSGNLTVGKALILNKFQISYNSDSDTLDFDYIG